jgi:hypothetical protein
LSSYHNQVINTLSKEIVSMKSKLDFMLSKNSEYVSKFEIIPVYDYVKIKNSKLLLHCEFNATYKIFKKILHNTYNIPIAKIVDDNKSL